MRVILAALSLVLVTSVTVGVDPRMTNAGTDEPITADLDGRPLPAVQAGQFYCHDFDFPRIRCFARAEDLEQSLAVRAASGTAASTNYVTVYSEPMYAGAYAHLSQNYEGLWTIGWNDRISSFKARNSAAGRFYQDWYAGGWTYSFCCNREVPGLSSAYDNQISSAYRR